MTYDPCRRCDGRGTLSIRLGKPDPARDLHMRYDGVWCVYPTVDCGVCLGSGFVKPRVERTYADGMFAVHSTKAEQLSFDDIFDKMGL